MTPLNKPVSRVTRKTVSNRPVVLTIAPCGSQDEARIGVRLLGTRTQYVCTLSDLYRVAALWHGQKEAAAKKQAKRDGIRWKFAKKKFVETNSIITP
jgi:hypothetical protein